MSFRASAAESNRQVLLPPGPPPELAPPPAGSRQTRLTGLTMGTTWSLAAVLPASVDDRLLSATLEKAFTRVISQMSQWDAGSDLSRFNRAPAGSRHALRPEFAYVLDCALQVARASGGAFDPTIGAASELWGFGASSPPTEPPAEREAARTRRFGWQDLTLEEDGRVLVQPGGLTLDFSAIAKGFAVDCAIDALIRLGIDHALLEIGGELRGMGLRADGLPWWVDLEIPSEGVAPEARIGLTGWSVATSGSYRRRRQAAGRSWSHTLDPASGAPTGEDILAVSVLHRGCMQADALATAICVLGPSEGLKFADATGIPARIVLPAKTVESAAWARWLGR